jgi:hypothetical protein
MKHYYQHSTKIFTCGSLTVSATSSITTSVDQKPIISVTATPSVTATSAGRSTAGITSTLAQMIAGGADTKPVITGNEKIADLLAAKSPAVTVSSSSIVTSASTSPAAATAGQDVKHSIAAVYENTCGSQEAIVERAKQVGFVHFGACLRVCQYYINNQYHMVCEINYNQCMA